jgi:hypothetical protein
MAVKSAGDRISHEGVKCLRLRDLNQFTAKLIPCGSVEGQQQLTERDIAKISSQGFGFMRAALDDFSDRLVFFTTGLTSALLVGETQTALGDRRHSGAGI